MNDPNPTVGSLQREVRAIALLRARGRGLFWTVLGGVWVVAAGGTLLLFFLSLAVEDGSRLETLATLFLLLYVGLAMVWVTSLLVLPVAVAHAGRRHRQIRRRLAAAPRAVAAEALLLLQEDPSPATRRLVPPLLRELGLDSHEVIPAPPAAGGGHEPTPVRPAPSAG